MKQKEENQDLEVVEFPEWMKDTPQNREYFKRVQDISKPHIVQDVDGFYYFQMTNTTSYGYMSETDLKIIAFILEKLNEPYEKELKKYFKKETEGGFGSTGTFNSNG